ncbi:hypothetical protein [Streptomyces coelicoflavus]|uniref:hypothetical protein n=1 Tax=Streptomyces coelicoflavus TaxID=285562 RepID=UPI003F4A696C
MDFTQRMFARSLLRQQLVDMDGTQFERFVDRLLGLLHTDYLPVRAHGPLGDVGADGLMLGDKVLYAGRGYGPPWTATSKSAHPRCVKPF